MIEPSTYYAYDAPPKSHGRVSTYTNYKCRCPECKQAKSEETKRYKKKYSAAVKLRIRANRELIVAAKTTPCADCGQTYPPYVMDLDHRDSGTKTAAVGTMVSYSPARLVEEIAKCDVVCANCHRVRTHATRQTDTHAFFHPR